VIAASMDADFPMIPCESALFSGSYKLISPRVVSCHVTAKASARLRHDEQRRKYKRFLIDKMLKNHHLPRK